MRKPLVVGLLVTLLVALLSAGPALSARKTVEVDDNYFVRPGDPPTVTVDRMTGSYGSGRGTTPTTSW